MYRRKVGQSLIEMALLLPIFLFFTMGIIEFGWYVYGYSSVENAARRGSEQASKEPPLRANVGSSTDGCVMEIRQQAKQGLKLISLSDSAVTISYPITGEDRALGSEIEVRVRYTGQFITPLTGLFRSRTFTVDFRSRRSIRNAMVTEASPRCP
jgi:hypothetical protein